MRNLERAIYVLTYNIAHRKTFDTLSLLKALGYTNVTVITCPMSYKKTFKPLIAHRPPTVHDIDTATLSKNLCYDCVALNSIDELLEERFNKISNGVILIAGAGFIPTSVIQKSRIINSHPGYLPEVRGLDAFKWAIYEGLPIGVTTHLLGLEVDGGTLIDRILLKKEPCDTFHLLAYRVYEHEIKMLVDAVELYNEAHEKLKIGSIVRKRMSNDRERLLEEKFKQYPCDENMYSCRQSATVC
jgi:phosphoribosylglycinamide formyltransferase-1